MRRFSFAINNSIFLVYIEFRCSHFYCCIGTAVNATIVCLYGGGNVLYGTLQLLLTSNVALFHMRYHVEIIPYLYEMFYIKTTFMCFKASNIYTIVRYSSSSTFYFTWFINSVPLNPGFCKCIAKQS